LARARASLRGKARYLIVCEGRETEANYLTGLRDAWRINAANVVIRRGDDRTDSLSLVHRARALWKEDPDFDRVFVVCDHEDDGVAAARDLAGLPLAPRSRPGLVVELILSRPSFEFWLLLHFEYTTRMFRDAKEVTRVLAQHLPGYDKADRRLYAKLHAGLEKAVAGTQQLKRHHVEKGVDVPDTDVPILVDALRRLASSTHGA